MKELSIEEKAKAYYEAIKYGRYLINERCKEGTNGSFYRVDLQKMFPELKESDDDRIKKVLIDYFKYHKEYGIKTFYDIPSDDVLAWLEKQGEQKPIEPTDLKTWKYIVDAVLTEREGIGQYIDSPWTTDVAEKLQKRFGNIEQNPINTSISFDTVTGVLRFNNLTLEQAEAMRKALFGEQKPVVPKFKVGDIVKDTEDGEIFTIRTVTKDKYIYTDDSFDWIKDQDGYELVEQKPAWSEEDEITRKALINLVEMYYGGCIDKSEKNRLLAWLKSLRPQKQQEWNKQDIEMIDWLIRCCEKEHEELCNDRYGHQDIVSDLKRDCRKKWDWLESLKNKVVPQNTWKPSDRQMRALKEVCNEHWDSDGLDPLYTLYQNLKKLREE